MSTTKISRRYAVALFDLIEEGIDVRVALESVALFASNDDVAAILTAPDYPDSVKSSLLKKAVSGKGSEEVSRLIDLLCTRGKSCLLPEISQMLGEMVAAAESVVDAELVSAIDLNSESQQVLTESLAAVVGKKVKLAFSRDESILGGVVIRIGDRKIDCSIRSKLDGMRRAIVS
ncbi:MAG: ATP synthase F1 subunit delta [Mariprofundaceae bacterium]